MVGEHLLDREKHALINMVSCENNKMWTISWKRDF